MVSRIAFALEDLRRECGALCGEPPLQLALGHLVVGLEPPVYTAVVAALASHLGIQAPLPPDRCAWLGNIVIVRMGDGARED